MYSVVLMVAMTTGTETPDCHRHGCCGGSSGYSGCYGSSYGCYGSSYGGCYGSSYGCYGSSYGGCYGSSYGGCYGSSYGGCYGGTPYKGTPVMSMPPGTKPETVTKPPKPDEAMIPAPARIIVSLPADAKLSFDGVPTASTSAERVFISPELKPNQDYRYTLRAEMVRDGRSQSVEQTVLVRAGRQVHVTLSVPTGLASR